MIYIFLTILAWAFLVGSIIRILAVLFAPRSIEEEAAIDLARMQGVDPVVNSLVKPTFTILVCLSWLIATLI